jgi:hypothetical protein
VPTLKNLCCGVIILGCVVVLGACGFSNTTDATGTTRAQAPLKKGSIGVCLSRSGALRADAVGDLEFLAEAEADDEVSKVAFAFDRQARLFVNVWNATTKDGRPPQWIVWFGQPFDSHEEPRDIVQSASADGYVMFLDGPTSRQRLRTSRCIRVGTA